MIFKTKYNNDYSLLHRYIHILLGGILAINKINYKYRLLLLFIILLYQFVQLFFNIRYFFNKNKLKNGNSLKHTINKLLDYSIGFFIVWIFFKLLNI